MLTHTRSQNGHQADQLSNHVWHMDQHRAVQHDRCGQMGTWTADQGR